MSVPVVVLAGGTGGAHRLLGGIFLEPELGGERGSGGAELRLAIHVIDANSSHDHGAVMCVDAQLRELPGVGAHFDELLPVFGRSRRGKLDDLTFAVKRRR